MMRPRRRKQKGGGQGLVLAVLAIAFLYLTLTGQAQVADAPVAAPEAEQAPLGEATGWQVVPEAALSPSQARQREQAAAARQQLAESLGGRLLTTVQNEGPVAALRVCLLEADGGIRRRHRRARKKPIRDGIQPLLINPFFRI